ncbi:hypothetical protein UFOVP1064_22 [uncultured Caudovirales phage]|uniref:Uncharacterized protein n=1 Tax=uncultured Caudovirales phage TaxID=2100421 RepID=A0A6J5QFY5_9CAUD|nr:hypothetical protein UFOVP659_53 [uncultured Caudovirales phage]CAB4169413.1 hypothetical protein UFOVP885_32 [uncultured Caudovirales phage]CAB4181277.1 hypothetical protein UFOVP1064_22 [uncultured Caudovirales phage]CAB4190182.1 hypothetical protein UFOVP1197_41 [uncultured Caudovirales phage]CAB4195947.1 hypothetical protein UFOVP1294_49 [uncultured Caudovirales phage]
MITAIRGVTYPSVKAAAEAEGVTVSAIYSALNRGNINTVGLGKSQPQPVEFEGLSFSSIRSASLALGFGRTYLSKVLSRESAHGLKKVADAVAAYKEKTK